MFIAIILIILGFVLLIKGSDVLVSGAAGVARRFKVPKLVMGLTLIAFGTSVPEFSVSIFSALGNYPDLSVANILGSNLANIALVLGLIAVIRGNVDIRETTITRGIPLNILAVLVLIISGFDLFFQNGGVQFNQFSRGDGLIFICFFIVFLYYIYADLKGTREKEEEISKEARSHLKDSYLSLTVQVVGGVLAVLVGGKLIVESAVALAQIFQVEEALIGLTIVAVGTSLPELFVSLVATIKGEHDLAVGNIIGSCIFNIFLVMGVVSVIHPIGFSQGLLIDAIVLLFVSSLLYFLVVRRKRLSKAGGAILLGIYVLYIVSLDFHAAILSFFV